MQPIAHFEKRYAIRDSGEIINLANNQPLSPATNPNGYLKVGLATGDGGHKQELVHVLVAKHFIPNPYNHPQVNHKNGIKTDCRKDNLEWVSPQGNALHALQTGLRPGYMSADDKEAYMYQVLNGTQVGDLAIQIGRAPETLHKMLRETASRLGIQEQWQSKMKENRRAAAIRNLEKING